mmetsp:Transcript_3994/g.8631  ORF Transcript_3994/g.8631 Transcript_3994/m.8631 type:complete len:295 (-) Transcript_3994:1953-2837(-)
MSRLGVEGEVPPSMGSSRCVLLAICRMTLLVEDSLPLSSSPRYQRSCLTRLWSYMREMAGSALASTISTRSRVPWKKGQCSYISLRMSSLLSLIAASSASPMPSHTGRCRRVWVQAKIQGMARSVSMPPSLLRLAGREPMLRRPSSLTGVALLKYSTNSGLWNTMARYSLHEAAARRVIMLRHSSLGAGGGSMHASSTALVYRSRVLKHTSRSPHCCSMISPCTVTRRVPWMVPEGWLLMAMWVGPPPRPTVPPLPWNSTSFTPCSLATAVIFSWASYRAHAAARRPASLPESE